jgi:excisionase family DNA binding protein
LKVREVAALLGVRPARVRELVRDGELRSIRLGVHGHHRFDRQDVERFLARIGRP